MASTQLVHNRVNLLRLVTRLEDEVERRQAWGSGGISAWVKASNVAQVTTSTLACFDTLLIDGFRTWGMQGDY
jgi:hypothetical protein